MDITIGNTKYRVVIRHVIEVAVRTRENHGCLVAMGTSKCHPPDKFDERKGIILAFKKCMGNLRVDPDTKYDLAVKCNRRKVWWDFLAGLGL